jgi:5'-3' exonuclease
MKYVVVFDYSNVFYIAASMAQKSGPDLLKQLLPSFQSITHNIRTILKDLGVAHTDIVYAEDRTPERKLSIYPAYRGERVGDVLGKEVLKQQLLDNGCAGKFCFSDGEEADDVLASIAELVKPQSGVVLVTMDRDLWQLIGEDCHIFHPIRRQFITEKDVFKSFGVGPKHVALFKSLWGDAGDCVPNAVPRMQKQLLPLVTASEGNLVSFYRVAQANQASLTKRCRQLLNEGKNQAVINWLLVNLRRDCILTWE